MHEDREMREEIRAGMKGRIRFNAGTDAIEVIVGEDHEVPRWQPINRLTMVQYLPPLVIERLWDMFADAAGSVYYADDRLAGVKFLGVHRVAEFIEQEGCFQIEEDNAPPLSFPSQKAVSVESFLSGKMKTTLAEIAKNVIDPPSEKDLAEILKNAGWESRRTATGRFWVKTRG